MERRMGTRWVVASMLTAAIFFLLVSGSSAAQAPPAAKPAPAKPKAKPAPGLVITDQLVAQIAKATKRSTGSVRLTLEFIQKYKPILARDLVTMMNEKPDKFRSEFSRAYYSAQNLAELKKSDPASYDRRERIYALQAQVDLLVEKYKAASEAEKPNIELQLTKLLGQIFDLRAEEDRYQLDRERKQLEDRQKRLDLRIKNKDRIVDRQLTRMLGIEEVLSWW